MTRWIRVQTLLQIQADGNSPATAMRLAEETVHAALVTALPQAFDVQVRALEAARPELQITRWWEPSRWDRRPGWPRQGLVGGPVNDTGELIVS